MGITCDKDNKTILKGLRFTHSVILQNRLGTRLGHFNGPRRLQKPTSLLLKAGLGYLTLHHYTLASHKIIVYRTEGFKILSGNLFHHAL